MFRKLLSVSGFTLMSRITGFSSSMHPQITASLNEGGENRILGCAVYNLFNVARGAFARFVNPKGARVWDLLAGLMLEHPELGLHPAGFIDDGEPGHCPCQCVRKHARVWMESTVFVAAGIKGFGPRP